MKKVLNAQVWRLGVKSKGKTLGGIDIDLRDFISASSSQCDFEVPLDTPPALEVTASFPQV
jgi:hypothetical protein